MDRQRIAVFGIFGKTNLGNEATLAAFLSDLRGRYPRAHIACVGPRGSAVEAGHGVELIDMEPLPVRQHFWRYYRWRIFRAAAAAAQLLTEPIRARAAAKLMRRFDIFLVPGTGILDDFGQGPLDLPYHLLRWCKAARRVGVPVHLVSVGTEPVAGLTTRAVLRRAAELSSSQSYRDEESKRNTANLGVSTQSDAVYPDLAFSLPIDRIAPDRPACWPPRRVGLGVMGYHGWNKTGEAGERIYQEYLGKLKLFVAWLLERGYSVRLLVGDTRADAKPVQDLVKWFSDAARAGSEARLIAEPIGDFKDLLEEISQTDIVVATRLHNVLLSLLLEQSTISVSYSTKTDVLLEEFGLGAYRQPIDELDVGTLIAQFTRLAEGDDPTASIRRMNLEYRHLLNEQYAKIYAQIGERPASENVTLAMPRGMNDDLEDSRPPWPESDGTTAAPKAAGIG